VSKIVIETVGRRILRIARTELGRRAPAAVERLRQSFEAARQAYREAAEADLLPRTSPERPFDHRLAAFYANLELPYGADHEAVAQAWKSLVKKYHPDLHAGDPSRQALANQVLQGLNLAYAELSRRLAAARAVRSQPG
jgi:DnaJ-domain-containing protein 1